MVSAKGVGIAVKFTPSDSNPLCLFNKVNCHSEILVDLLRITKVIYGKEKAEFSTSSPLFFPSCHINANAIFCFEKSFLDIVSLILMQILKDKT